MANTQAPKDAAKTRSVYLNDKEWGQLEALGMSAGQTRSAWIRQQIAKAHKAAAKK